MDLAYATIADCADILPSLTSSNEESGRIEASLAQSLLDASRLFETDVFAPVNYFAKSGDTFTTKTFYSKGIQYILLHPYTEIEWIHNSDDEVIDVDTYRLNDDFNANDPRHYWLKWLYGGCGGRWWWMDASIQVSAKWGFPCVPPDVVLAVRSMACLMFLNNPQARVGLESSLEDNQEQRLRNTYGKIMGAWSDKLHHRWNLGVG